MSNLYVISGPSGVGKDTLVALVFERIPNLKSSVSVTSRPPRKGEKEGREYFFKSKEEVKELINNGGLAEWNEYAGNIYGTPKSFIDEQLKEGNDILLSIDVNGAFNIKKHYPDSILIFILPPSIDELRKRLLNRGTETEEQIERRLSIAEAEIKRSSEFTYRIVNDKIEEAANKIVKYIANDNKLV
ncbi:MAG: guanylate kinase [Coriobacteriia bacterium]|nr:guanylate kinase [Coriobacteriia bacterium]